MREQKELSLMCLSQLPPGGLWFSDQMIPNEYPLSDSTEYYNALESWYLDTENFRRSMISPFALWNPAFQSPGLLAPTNVQEFPTRFQQFHGLHDLASILWWLRVIENGKNVGKCGESGENDDIPWKCWRFRREITHRPLTHMLILWSSHVTFAGTQHAKCQCFTSAHFRMMKSQSSLVIFSPRIVLQLNAWNPKLQLCRIFWTCHPRGPARFGSQNVAQLGLS